MIWPISLCPSLKFPVSSPTLTNQGRELQKEAVLSACEHLENKILLSAVDR